MKIERTEPTVNSANQSIPIKKDSKVLKIALGVLLGVCGAAALYTWYNSQGFVPPKIGPLLDPREIEVMNLLGEGALKLDPNSSLPKALFQLAFTDYNGAYQINGPDSSLLKSLSTLNKSYDLQFNILKKPQDLCDNIAAAIKLGDLKTIVIAGHGEENRIYINEKSWTGMIGRSLNPKIVNIAENCFAGLPEDTQITLLSCLTGKYKDGIANAIATVAQRVVWAPSDVFCPIATSFSETVPAVPIFYDNGCQQKDLTCKFLPDDTRICR